ncbi:hypothetical protein Sgly_1431 [Syntrophobotulus glycolicus DSM 8271]|uniref:Uncharacterized protein n=1 Tax=Syntrophobotulus glycolicus (strain DSM 8271 / FlGlyR) TaxID=645991 RepID=F0SWG7_SYNGF|nr:hypothetical protein [Syntrophobotulus glycolicus]ADY55733.1 hypothetical protein Sgly_1431 [Syntrophobotulus glycolicus DSM 8271]
MKVIAENVEMVAWFDHAGTPRPVRFRHRGTVVRVENIQEIRDERLAGQRIKLYRCQSIINEELKVYELKYELDSCKWYLWKG